MEIVRELELRHPGQIGSIRVAVRGDALMPGAIREDFDAAHRRLYGHDDAASPVEITALFVTGAGRLQQLVLDPLSERTDRAAAPIGTRAVYFPQTGRVETRIFRGSDMGTGASIAGPAIVEEETTCIVVSPGDVCSVDAFGNYIIRFTDTDRA
jgi:N-methylhydantoinase A